MLIYPERVVFIEGVVKAMCYMLICSVAVADRIKEVGYEYIANIAAPRDWLGIMATWCITHR